jgi:sugar phosphate isomerase/epimerase
MLCVSNLGWHHYQYEQRSPLLDGLGLEIAPTKIWPDWNLDSWRPMQPIIAMESLFCKPEHQLLGDQDLFFNHWSLVCKMAEKLGVQRLIYGSPKLRKGRDIQKALSHLDRMARMTEALVCLEVLPTAYGAELFTSFEESFKLAVGREWKICLNTGAYIASGEAPEMIDVTQVGHVHVSEPAGGLLESTKSQIDIAEVLSDGEYTGHVTLELPPCNPKQLSRGIRFIQAHY